MKLDVAEMVFDRVQVHSAKTFGRHMLDTMRLDERYADAIAKDMVLSLNAYVMAHDLDKHTTTVHFSEVVEYPATWWQMFKHQYFPQSWKDIWPVGMTSKRVEASKEVSFKVFAIYPEADVPVPPQFGSPVYKTEIHTKEVDV